MNWKFLECVSSIIQHSVTADVTEYILHLFTVKLTVQIDSILYVNILTLNIYPHFPLFNFLYSLSPVTRST